MIKNCPIEEYDNITILRQDLQITGSYKIFPAIAITEPYWDTIDEDIVYIDSSSGNYLKAIAYLSYNKNFKATMFVPENISEDKLAFAKEYGDNLDIKFTPKEGSSDLAQSEAFDFAEVNGYVYNSQYSSYSGIEGYTYLAKLIIQSYDVSNLTHFVAGLGTSAFIQGIGRWLKIVNPNIRIVAAQVSGVNFVEGIKSYSDDKIPDIFVKNFIDEWMYSRDTNVYRMYDELNDKLNIQTPLGTSSALNYLVAKTIADVNPDNKVLTVFPDSTGVNL